MQSSQAASRIDLDHAFEIKYPCLLQIQKRTTITQQSTIINQQPTYTHTHIHTYTLTHTHTRTHTNTHHIHNTIAEIHKQSNSLLGQLHYSLSIIHIHHRLALGEQQEIVIYSFGSHFPAHTNNLVYSFRSHGASYEPCIPQVSI